MGKSLEGKFVLVTGSSSGIGRETAMLFAKEKCSVVITYHKEKKEAEEASRRCLKNGASATLVLPLNVMDDASMQNVVQKTKQKFGRIDILVNNAGVVVWKPFEEQTFADIENQMRTNLEGLIKMTKEALPMVKDTIINIASGAGISGYADLTTYCATKFGVRGFTKALAEELDTVAVFCVNPGMTATRMTDFQGVPPQKVAEVIVNTAKGVYKRSSGSDINVWEV